MTSNAELLKALKKAPRVHYYLCDLHVHSPVSFDVRFGERFELLSDKEKRLLLGTAPSNHEDCVQYERNVQSAFPVERYHELLVERRNEVSNRESISEGEDWAFIAITDHNVCEYAASLSRYAWQQRSSSRLVILPGIELDVSFAIEGGETAIAHIILIFSPGTQSSDIRVAIRDLTTSNWTFGQTAEISKLPKFVSALRSHPNYPAIAIAAHISSAKGLRDVARKGHENMTFTALDAAMARALGEIEHNADVDKAALESQLQQLENKRKREAEKISLEVLKLVGSCGFDALQVSCKQDEIHYRRLHRFREVDGRAIPFVASDAHRIADVFACEDNVPYLKLPVQSPATTSDQILPQLRHAIRYGETRFSYCTPGQVRKWIAGVEIVPDAADASRFWPFSPDEAKRDSFTLSLSRNLNCFIGGRGSGKSAAIEALAFVTVPAGFEGKQRSKEEGLDDWYKRARATLAGCQVRLVWQTSGKTEDLPKGALFCSRYFKPVGEHGPVSYTNLEDKEILGSALSLETPQLFRAREIENAAEPSRLRQLFDGLVGERIPAISEKIENLVNQLAVQRAEMVTIAGQITDLTQEDTPLREYVRRKAAYESANRPEVQPFYKRLDEAAAAEDIALDLQKRWDRAQQNADFERGKSTLLGILDALEKRIRDQEGDTKPYCEGMAEFFEKDKDGKSARDRLEYGFKHLSEQLDSLKNMIMLAVTQTASEHKNAREALTKEGLPPGAKDREAKKVEFEAAERDFAAYRELLQQWQDLLEIRNNLFADLVRKCEERTQLRVETAERICSQLDRDLDPSILLIRIEVHPMEDRSAFRSWLSENVRPCIPKSKDARISALLDKRVMPKEIRDSLLGEVTDCSLVFVVEKDKAGEGRVEKDLADAIVRRCSGKVRLEPEHETMKETVSAEFVDRLPAEFREGLWTFPKTSGDSNHLIFDSVLALDEVVFDDRPEVLLNDRPREAGSRPRPIGELSNGQRCSAILPILLLNGRSPLIIDQPEDNLDNRLIRQVIVNILASIKLRRQVIVATHNPNLPVLGDVEQAIVLRAIEEKQAILESAGDLDSAKTVALVTEIMEGGREAFQYRQSIYQAHWSGPVSQSI